jgi:hypothetical protein
MTLLWSAQAGNSAEPRPSDRSARFWRVQPEPRRARSRSPADWLNNGGDLLGLRLYKKARAGEIKGFTGIDAPYEPPEKPELVLDSNSKSINELAQEVIAFLESKKRLSL